MNNIYLINKIASDTSSSEIFPTRTFKGDVTIKLDFSNIVETEIKLVKIKIDFNDGVITEKVYNNNTNLFESIYYTYPPSSSNYLITKFCSVNLIFSNFTTHSIIIPINIAQASFLSEYGSLSVKKAQFIDNNTGDMFLILESEKHNLYNTCIKLGGYYAAGESLVTGDNILITDNEDPFETNFEYNIKV